MKVENLTVLKLIWILFKHYLKFGNTRVGIITFESVQHLLNNIEVHKCRFDSNYNIFLGYNYK